MQYRYSVTFTAFARSMSNPPGGHVADMPEAAFCRLKAVDSPATDEEVEEQLENQLESLIRHCRDELRLIPKMAGTHTRRQYGTLSFCLICCFSQA